MFYFNFAATFIENMFWKMRKKIIVYLIFTLMFVQLTEHVTDFFDFNSLSLQETKSGVPGDQHFDHHINHFFNCQSFDFIDIQENNFNTYLLPVYFSTIKNVVAFIWRPPKLKHI
jgi:hypothetical protein